MSESKETVTRREFLKIVLTGVGACYAAAIGYPVFKYLASPAEQAKVLSAVKEVTLKDAHTLAAGSVLMFKFGSRPAMLIHHKDNSWVALDAVCTHLGCTVAYQPERDVIHCNCHGGEYDARTGKNISGPPPRPLRAYAAKVIEGGVLVSRV
ncbi:MAG: Rieske (2Fe-2S) protein [Candidatus Omnitrophica bacterium]|nr:Rieske (2Fe-2S) protein [Candidatus Omnitrophota bacterium]